MEIEDRILHANILLKRHASKSCDEDKLENIIRKYIPYLKTYPDDIIAISKDRDIFKRDISQQLVWRKYTDPNRLITKSEVSDLFDIYRIMRGDKIYFRENNDELIFRNPDIKFRPIFSPIPSGYFYWVGGLFFILAFQELERPAYAIILVSICLIMFIYPIVRFLTGGRDGFLPLFLSTLVEEYLKYWFNKKINDTDKNLRNKK